MKFLLQATTLSVLAASISFATDSSAQLCMLMAFLIAVFHGLLADSIRYRRLVHRLGGLHEIFANAARMEYLPILMRTQKALNRWWRLQLAYELGLGLVLIVLLPAYIGAIAVRDWWVIAPALAVALSILTAPTACQIWNTRVKTTA